VGAVIIIFTVATSQIAKKFHAERVFSNASRFWAWVLGPEKTIKFKV
jgi:hypothetical protein